VATPGVGTLPDMTDYTAPVRDIRFVLEHVTPLGELTKLDAFSHADPELVHGLLEEAGRFLVPGDRADQPRRRRRGRSRRR
jgi:hypothetical protein